MGRSRRFTHFPPGISSESSEPQPDNHTVTCTMSWQTSGNTGLLTPPCFDPRWNSPLSANMQPCGWSSPGSSWGSSPMVGAYAGEVSPQTAPMNISPVQTEMRVSSMIPSNQFIPSTSPRPYVPYLPKPTVEKSGRSLRDQTVHGAKMQEIADAQRLWSRLDEHSPHGPNNPENGFIAIDVQLAQYGREYVRIGLEQTPAKAWMHWRSIRRAHFHFGGTSEDELYEDYRQAVKAYQLRHGSRMRNVEEDVRNHTKT